MCAQIGTQASVSPLNKGHRQGQSDENEKESCVNFWIQLHCDFRGRLSKENRRGRSPSSTCPSAQKRRSANPLQSGRSAVERRFQLPTACAAPPGTGTPGRRRLRRSTRGCVRRYSLDGPILKPTESAVGGAPRSPSDAQRKKSAAPHIFNLVALTLHPVRYA